LSVVSKTYKHFVERLSFGGRGPEPAFRPIEALAGSLVYDTGFPFQQGNSREPGFESRRPHSTLSSNYDAISINPRGKYNETSDP
jgi:hypothetical protein